MRLRLDHPNLRMMGQSPVLLASGAPGIVGGVVGGNLGRGHHWRGSVLLASVQCPGLEPVLRRSRGLGGWRRPS